MQTWDSAHRPPIAWSGDEIVIQRMGCEIRSSSSPCITLCCDLRHILFSVLFSLSFSPAIKSLTDNLFLSNPTLLPQQRTSRRSTSMAPLFRPCQSANHLVFFVLLLSLFSFVSAGDDCLSAHNYYRSLHGVPPLEYDRTLEEFAMKRAKYMAQTDIFAHPQRLPYGENLYWKSGRVPSCKNALEMWYREKKWYNYASGSFSSSTGHFTQMIWAGSQYLGCASAKSRSTGRIYIACNYWPQGNVRTQFKENVPPPGKYYAYN